MRTAIIIGLCWAGFVVLLGVVPWQFPPPSDLQNVAALLGYNVDLAYVLVVGWIVIFALLTMAIYYRTLPPNGSSDDAAPRSINPALKWSERLVVALGVAAAYWPWSLARYGPYLEDNYFLNVLWRMHCGDKPYIDFEFLYGPLMVIPLGWWAENFGFSMSTYFAFYVVLQVLFFVYVLWAFQNALPLAHHRYLAFAVILPFIVDLLLGLNWVAWRYFAILPVVLVIARDPRSLGAPLVAGALVGLQTAYSYEYGLLAGFSAAAMLMALLFEPGRATVMRSLAVLIVTSFLAWLCAAWMLLGEDFTQYLGSMVLVASNAQANGLGQFAFYWTGHSLSWFLVLSVVVVMFGAALGRLGKLTATSGDLQAIGATVFAIVALKVAFQRADFYHLTIPFVALAIILLFNPRLRLLDIGVAARRIAIVGICLASIGQIIGHIPRGEWIVTSSLKGTHDEIRGVPRVVPIASREPSIQSERTHAQKHVAQLAARFNEPDLNTRPVMFYSSAWKQAMLIDVCPVGYSFYEILYSDQISPLKDAAAETDGLVVLIREGEYESLQTGSVPELGDTQLAGWPKLALTTSSVHYSQSRIETQIEFDIWKKHLGNYLMKDFQIFDRVGNFVVLEHSAE